MSNIDYKSKDRRHRATEAAFGNVLTENSTFRIQLHDLALLSQEQKEEIERLEAELAEARKPGPPGKKKAVAKAVAAAKGNGKPATP